MVYLTALPLQLARLCSFFLAIRKLFQFTLKNVFRYLPFSADFTLFHFRNFDFRLDKFFLNFLISILNFPSVSLKESLKRLSCPLSNDPDISYQFHLLFLKNSQLIILLFPELELWQTHKYLGTYMFATYLYFLELQGVFNYIIDKFRMILKQRLKRLGKIEINYFKITSKNRGTSAEHI